MGLALYLSRVRSNEVLDGTIECQHRRHLGVGGPDCVTASTRRKNSKRKQLK
jgi:hypothetical protein